MPYHGVQGNAMGRCRRPRVPRSPKGVLQLLYYPWVSLPFFPPSSEPHGTHSNMFKKALYRAPGDSSWFFLAFPMTFSWFSRAPPGFSWLLLAAPGASWLLLVFTGWSWPLPGNRRAHAGPGRTGGLGLLGAPCFPGSPGSLSLILLGPPGFLYQIGGLRVLRGI